MQNAQFTLRNGGNTAHVQVGSVNHYDKFDVPATPALRGYFESCRNAGTTNNSFADTTTQYAPVSVEEKVVRRIVAYVPAQTIVLSE